MQARSSITARRSKERSVEAANKAAAAERGPAVLQRVLLGLVTALVVARPLVPGEDPGKLLPGASPADLTLTFLWLLAAVGGAAWWAWNRPAAWNGGLVELALAGVVALAFVSTIVAASYKHPAWIISWEWAVLLVIIVLVRQVATRAGDDQRLLAAILATGVTLAGFAVYQHFVDLPRLRADYEADPSRFLQIRNGPSLVLETNTNPVRPERMALTAVTARFTGPLQSGATLLAMAQVNPADATHAEEPASNLVQRIQEGRVFGTFGRPETFAAYLALLLPVLVAAAMACRLRLGWSLQTLLTTAAVGLVAAALLLTQSPAAVLALLLVAAMIGIDLICRRLGLGFLARVAAVAVLLFLGRLTAPWWDLPAIPWDAWKATLALIDEYTGLGVGPGNFGRNFPRFRLSPATPKLADPQNFALEVAGTCGVVALLTLLVSLGAFFWRTSTAETPPEKEAEDEPLVRWEFYYGGVAGLILAFVIRASQLPGSEILHEGAVAAGRSLVWFGAFALLESVPWFGRLRVAGISAGVGALLLTLTVTSGIGFPSLAQPLWVMVALGLCAVGLRPRSWPIRHWLAYALPVPLVVAAWLTYLFQVYVPLGRSAYAWTKVQRAYLHYRTNVDPAYRSDFAGERRPESRVVLTGRTEAFLNRNLLQPLDAAAFTTDKDLPSIQYREQGAAQNDDPTNSYLKAVVASLYGLRWRLSPGDPVHHQRAEANYLQAQALDPLGTDGYWAQYLLSMQYAPRAPEAGRRLYQYEQAAHAVTKLVENDPQEPRLRYLLAEILFSLGQVPKATREAAQAWDLDRLAHDPRTRLTPDQRDRVRLWLGIKSGD